MSGLLAGVGLGGRGERAGEAYKQKNATCIHRQTPQTDTSDTRSGGTRGSACPGRPSFPPVKVRAGESRRDPSQCLTGHAGAFGRLPRCWHSNEKVNIEPKILGVAGCGVAGKAQRGNSYLGPAWLYPGLRGKMAPQEAGEGTDWGWGPGRGGGLLLTESTGREGGPYIVF